MIACAASAAAAMATCRGWLEQRHGAMIVGTYRATPQGGVAIQVTSARARAARGQGAVERIR